MQRVAMTETIFASDKLQVFCEGQYDTKYFTVSAKSSTSSPPKPLFIVTPIVEGIYPVILFFHGFILRNNFYSDLLHHIASHGFIVVAPQFCEFFWSSEVELAGAVVNWLVSGLQSNLPENVVANLGKLSLVGHSRGGQTAFSLASSVNTLHKFSTLVGIDPVAIDTDFPNFINLSIPVTVIGTGLGGDKANWLTPPCAPEGRNHMAFFNNCNPPCAHFVTKDFGHMEMLNDNLAGCFWKLVSRCTCKNGMGCRQRMRKCVGGIVVAFLKFYLDNEGDNNGDFLKIVQEPNLAPVALDPPVFREKIIHVHV